MWCVCACVYACMCVCVCVDVYINTCKLFTILACKLTLQASRILAIEREDELTVSDFAIKCSF